MIIGINKITLNIGATSVCIKQCSVMIKTIFSSVIRAAVVSYESYVPLTTLHFFRSRLLLFFSSVICYFVPVTI